MSSNELQSLPVELCSLRSLRDLNVRRNQLSTLPDGKESEPEGMVSVLICVFIGSAAVTHVLYIRWVASKQHRHCPQSDPVLCGQVVLGFQWITNIPSCVLINRAERAPGSLARFYKDVNPLWTLPS